MSNQSSETFINSISNEGCLICYNSITVNNICKTDCNHTYCSNCLMEWFNRGNTSCPYCRGEINRYTYNGDIYRITVINKITNSSNQGQAQGNENINGGGELTNQSNRQTDFILIHRLKLIYLRILLCLSILYIAYLHIYYRSIEEDLHIIYMNRSNSP